MNRTVGIIVLVLLVIIAGVIALSFGQGGAVEEEAAVEPTSSAVEETAEPVEDQAARQEANAPVARATKDTADVTETEAAAEAVTPDAAEVAAEAAAGAVADGEAHFQNCAFRTGANAVIAVTVDAVNSSGLELEPGDEVAVFTPDGQVCAGVSRWEGRNIAVTAWGDDEQTDEIDGLREGDEMVFHIWDKSEQEEIVIAGASYELGDGIYTVDGIHAVSGFTLE